MSRFLPPPIGPSAILLLINFWPALSLYLKERPCHGRPAEDRGIGEMENIVKTIVILLGLVIRKRSPTLSPLQRRRTYSSIRSALHDIHFNPSWQTLLGIFFLVEKRRGMRCSGRGHRCGSWLRSGPQLDPDATPASSAADTSAPENLD